MKGNRRRQPFLPAVPVARNLGGGSSEVSWSARGRSSESSGMADRSASISRRRRTMSISFSHKTTFTSFTLTSSEDLCRCRFNIRQGKFICQIRDQYYKGGIGVRHAGLSPRRGIPDHILESGGIGGIIRAEAYSPGHETKLIFATCLTSLSRTNRS